MSDYARSGSGNYGRNGDALKDYTVVGYSSSAPSQDPDMSFLCRGTCGTEMGCTCGRKK